MRKIGGLVACLFFMLFFIFNSYAVVRVPVASGTSAYDNSKVLIDYSNLSQGYFMLRYNGSNGKVKLQVTKNTTYTYDVKERGNFEVFPLTEGNGGYTLKVYENVSGNEYAQVASQTINVSLENEYLPFLYPSQYVNFSEGNAAIALSNSLYAGNILGTVTNVYNYVVDNLSYDNVKANSVQSGYLPNIDSTLATRNGICFDYAALMSAMLRAQDIPTKLVVGYQGSVYHAWISVYSAETGWIDNVISFDGQNWTLMDPTYASTGGRTYGGGSYGVYTAKYMY